MLSLAIGFKEALSFGTVDTDGVLCLLAPKGSLCKAGSPWQELRRKEGAHDLFAVFLRAASTCAENCILFHVLFLQEANR